MLQVGVDSTHCVACEGIAHIYWCDETSAASVYISDVTHRQIKFEGAAVSKTVTQATMILSWFIV